MLQILTGDIQIGKTRWLQRRVEAMSKQGLTCYGVVSPGIWREYQASDGSLEYEKLGSEVLLLPQGRRLPFARRRDLAEAEEVLADKTDRADKTDKADKADRARSAESQSSKAGLGWAIADASIAAVNAHFDWIAAEAESAAPHSAADDQQQGLLVIDELGRLELMHGCGFSSAVRLLEQGPTRLYADALVVARDSLSSLVQQRFASYWGGVQWLSPGLPATDKL